MKYPLLSILIINWNSKEYVKKCLESVFQYCSDFDPHIVVVDSGSFDGCEEMIATEFPGVEFVQSKKNLGFGKANNLGFKRVCSEYLLLLNPDTELRQNTVNRMLNVFERFSDVGIVGPRILNTDGSLQKSCVRALPSPLNQAIDCDFMRKMFPKSKLWHTYEAFSAKEPIEVPAVSGACMLLKSELYKRIGGFSPDFFMYAEDMDLCFRVRRMGLKIYHVPNAVVVHHGGGSSEKRVSSFSILHMREATYTYMLKNHGPYKAGLYRFLQGVSALIRMGIMLPLIHFSQDVQNVSLRYSFQKWKIILRWVLKIDSP